MSVADDALLDAYSAAVISVADRVGPAVCAITVPSRGSGSGVVLSADGLVVTNQHVVAGAREVTIRLAGGQEGRAQVLGSDVDTDLALLQTDGACESGYASIPERSSRRCRPAVARHTPPWLRRTRRLRSRSLAAASVRRSTAANY